MERTAGAVEGVQLQAEAAEARLSSAVESLRAAVAATSEEDSVLTARSQVGGVPKPRALRAQALPRPC